MSQIGQQGIQHKFNVGQKVIVSRKWSRSGYNYNWIENMDNTFGKIYTIAHITSGNDFYYYRMKEFENNENNQYNGNNWFFLEDALDSGEREWDE